MAIKGRADSRSEDKLAIFPESASQQPVLRLAVEMLMQRPEFLGTQPGRRREHDVGAEARTYRGL